MTVEDIDTVDFTAVDKASGEVFLVIVDHLDWDEKTELDHAWKLQEKLNAYLRFLESGEVYDSLPAARGKEIDIRVVGKYPLNEMGKAFFQQAEKIIKGAGFRLKFELSTHD